MSNRKFKEEYLIGYGYPYVYRSGLSEGVIFYSDTDKRLSNTRDTHFPREVFQGRDVPEYELVLRRKHNGTAKKWKEERRREEENREERKAAKKRNSKTGR